MLLAPCLNSVRSARRVSAALPRARGEVGRQQGGREEAALAASLGRRPQRARHGADARFLACGAAQHVHSHQTPPSVEALTAAVHMLVAVRAPRVQAACTGCRSPPTGSPAHALPRPPRPRPLPPAPGPMKPRMLFCPLAGAAAFLPRPRPASSGAERGHGGRRRETGSRQRLQQPHGCARRHPARHPAPLTLASGGGAVLVRGRRQRRRLLGLQQGGNSRAMGTPARRVPRQQHRCPTRPAALKREHTP